MTKTRFTLILLVLLSIIWGVGWPMVSLGLPYCPVYWYGALRLLGGTVLAFIILGASKQLIWPTRQDLPAIISVGLFQMGIFILLMVVALQYVPPGRSSLICYLSPLFVTPIAVFAFKEHFNIGKILGLILGLAGIVILFSPWQMNWHDSRLLLGNGLLLLNALIWALGTLHMRYAPHKRPAHLLLPWQLLIGTLPNLLAAIIITPHPHFIWHADLWISMLYSIFLNTLAGYLLVILVTRRLPVITSSLGLLLIPVVSLLASVALKMEMLTTGMLIALLLIIGGLICITLDTKITLNSKEVNPAGESA